MRSTCVRSIRRQQYLVHPIFVNASFSLLPCCRVSRYLGGEFHDKQQYRVCNRSVCAAGQQLCPSRCCPAAGSPDGIWRESFVISIRRQKYRVQPICVCSRAITVSFSLLPCCRVSRYLGGEFHDKQQYRVCSRSVCAAGQQLCPSRSRCCPAAGSPGIWGKKGEFQGWRSRGKGSRWRSASALGII